MEGGAMQSTISLDLTLRSGQVFHWDKREDGSWTGLIGDTPVRVIEKKGVLQVEKKVLPIAKTYFSLDHPLEDIYSEFPSDPMCAEALALCRGLRIIRQPVSYTHLTLPTKRIV